VTLRTHSIYRIYCDRPGCNACTSEFCTLEDLLNRVRTARWQHIVHQHRSSVRNADLSFCPEHTIILPPT
jgi:hypothetical protein